MGKSSARSIHEYDELRLNGFAEVHVMKAGLALLVAAVAALGAWLWTPDLPRVEIESRYSHGIADFREIQGVRLHVRDEGPARAPVVILLHGFGASLQSFDAWSRGLPEYRVIRVDLPGFGLSAVDPTDDYTDTRSLQLLLTLMDSMNIERATLAGHSIGGRIAWKFAAAHPQRVARLVLISPDGFASPGFEYGKAADVPAMLGLMRYALPKSLLKMNLLPGYADPDFVSDSLVARYHDLMRAPGARDAMLRRLQQTVLEDPRPILARIAAPTLLLWGEQDAMIPIANAEDYLRVLRDARIVRLPGVGHLAHEEGAAASLAALRGFLAAK
jgi:pimeloyl-ACP methyl ester carboxylesterase